MTDHLDHDHGGLQQDLPHLLDRRRALHLFGAVGVATIAAGCTSDDTGSPASTDTAPGPDSSGTTATTADGGTTAPSTVADGATGSSTAEAVAPGPEIPDETAGPFPADGTNGPNVLTIDGVVRSDLTTSIGDLSGTAEGIESTIELTLVDAATGEPRPGAALYIWHCTADARYTVYEVEDQNYLRGIQEADEAGRMTFTTVFPGCYRGRWPHAHFEVYDSLGGAIAGTPASKVSQLAIPRADCEAVYVDDRYGDSTANLAELTLAGDGVFRDGWDHQLATVAGSNADGYTISLLVRV